ncbi:MAG: response regulator [Candidatus Omnitrophica bacterium]|nr:response regulator [Candidatus Omnitrophota bacterium]MBL7151678.1 response regulator [Candidatus Omnitrophota bacterium]
MSANQKKILLVDDEPEVLEHLSNILQRNGFEVISTANGTEVIELVKKEAPDLIILDILLPDKPGDEIAGELTEDPDTAGIPIIFLTGVVTKEEIASAEKCGRHYVLAKPVTKETILSTIEKVL